MCGIAGFAARSLKSEDSAEIILRMLGMIQHRGPDEQGYYVDGAVALGAARLSIIDGLTGQQPLADEAERFWIAYNGEVYNYLELREELLSLGHRFHTRSDTEVVLEAWKAWGTAAPERFNGGFAFAIYDSATGELALARDRWGKRPLYYTTGTGGLVFASEMKAFLEFPQIEFHWDPDRLRSLFTIWTPLPDETPFRGIHQVLPGTCLIVNHNVHQIVPYVRSRVPGTVRRTGVDDAPALARELLSNSVRLRLRSDVPVGTYLSGGLDSAIVTRLAQQHATRTVQTFSVAFDEVAFDESGDQLSASRYLETRHSSLLVHAEDIGDAFPDAVWSAELPVFRSAFVPMFLLSRLVRKEGLKVVLTGEGADEVFLGYDIFREAAMRERWPLLTAGDRRIALSTLYGYEPHFHQANVAALSAVFAEHSRAPDSPLFSHEMRFANGRLAARLLGVGDWGAPAFTDWLTRQDPDFSSRSVLSRAQRLEFVTLLAGYLLSTQGDRMAMAHGVENRCPFLDPHVVEWAGSLPVDERLKTGFAEKWILRRAFANELPPAVLEKRKLPYRAPDAAAFLGGKRPEYLEEMLSERALTAIGILDVPFTLRFVSRVLSLRGDRIAPRESQALLLLLSVSILDRYFVRRQFPRAPGVARLVRARIGSPPSAKRTK